MPHINVQVWTYYLLLMTKYKVCYEGNKPLICSFFIDNLETMRVKVLEGRKEGQW